MSSIFSTGFGVYGKRVSWFHSTALVTVANAHLQKSKPPRFQKGIDGRDDQHAITDVINSEIGDIFIDI
jgi:hypothetical protein